MPDARHILLLSILLLLVFGVPATQAIVDVCENRTPQALEILELTEPDDGLPWHRRFWARVGTAMDNERLRQFEEALESNSVFEEWGRERFQLAGLLVMSALGDKVVRGRDDWHFYYPGVRYLAEPYFRNPHSASFRREDPVQVIVDFAKELRVRGVDLLVVPVPGKASIYADRLANVDPGPAIWANTTQLRAELHGRGIHTVDLHTALMMARERDPNRQLYMKADTHWTGDGIRVAAAALAQRVRAGGWAPEPSLRYRREPVYVHRWGDVLEMTRIPGSRDWFDSERVVVYQVSGDGGELYEDSLNADILWLGDSFSRVFQTDHPGAAGLIANLACELGTPLTSLVHDGGASTLVREQLARQPELLDGKNLVIWEFVERDVRFGTRGWRELEMEIEIEIE